jgi:subtilisin-like proprotein convertase family protein
MHRSSLVPFALVAACLVPAVAADGPQPRHAGPDVVEAAEPGPAGEPRLHGTLYSHGEPTNEEQLLLELMNRARIDPVAEADRVFADYGDVVVKQNVDHYVRQRPGVEFTRAENRAAFQSYTPRAPFSFDPLLIEAARKHSALGRQNDDQSHQYPGEAGLLARVQAEGYSLLLVGESVFMYARNMLHAHAGFAVDWGQAVPQGETRPYLGHRNSLMNHDGTRPYVQVGIGIVADADPQTDVGPRLVTIDFGQPSSSTRYVTGVCYEDRDGDGFYSAGEGLAGVLVEATGTTFHTYSSASGGYALPVPGNAGAITVTALGDANGPSATVGRQVVDVTMAGANVKLDFTTPPDPSRPSAQTFASSAATALAGAARTEATIDVTAFDATSTTVGDVDVALHITHPDVSQLRVALVSPAGTEVVLFDHGAPGTGLEGEFDATLAPVGDLGDFVGETYAGTWRLRVDDASSDAGREITSWSVRVRPAWVRSVFGPRTNLGLATFRATDAAAPAADQIRVAGVLDASGRALNPAAPVHLRLLDGTGAEISRHDVTALAASGAAKLKTAFAVAGTSRATFDLRVKGLDLAGPFPSPLTVELSLGGAIARTTVPVVAGSFNGKTTLPAAPWFFVESLRSQPSKTTPGERTTTVKGRVAGGPQTVAEIASIVEVFLGDVQAKVSAASLTKKGNRITAKPSGALRQFIYDTKTGVFQVQVQGVHQPLQEGVVPFSLRIGSLFGDAEVLPRAAGVNLTY